MNIILFGPQGSGKGTQARVLSDEFGFFYFESGEFLRKIAKNNKELQEALDRGELVPDTEMTSYLTAFLDQKNLYDDIIFDGFPRTVDQYLFFKNWLVDKEVSFDFAVVLDIPEEETIRRLTARRMDPTTGKIYNLITDPPAANVDQSTLIHREDDKPEAIKTRLANYRERTEPLIAEIGKDVEVIEIDGTRSIEVISQDLINLVKSHKTV